MLLFWTDIPASSGDAWAAAVAAAAEREWVAGRERDETPAEDDGTT